MTSADTERGGGNAWVDNDAGRGSIGRESDHPSAEGFGLG